MYGHIPLITGRFIREQHSVNFVIIDLQKYSSNRKVFGLTIKDALPQFITTMKMHKTTLVKAGRSISSAGGAVLQKLTRTVSTALKKLYRTFQRWIY